MKVPLSWLAEYVKLPPTKQLTDRLTMIGHLLDKELEVNGETVIDLELRGNRADLFGIVGIAREVSAAFETSLIAPKTVSLPRIDSKSPLITVNENAFDLVSRFTALKLSVKIKPSPAWMRKRLEAYGVPAINNVIDITNYVMLETAQPIHAFDYGLLRGGHLTLRRAKSGEIFHTIQQGTNIKLSSNDLVISDDEKAQTLMMIGGFYSGVNEKTEETLIEAAIYNQGSCRRTARRLKIATDAGTRQEKNLDPYGVGYALERAVYLLKELADAKVTSETSDYFPNPPKQTEIEFDENDIFRLGGVVVPGKEVVKMLNNLEFKTEAVSDRVLKVTVPTFRTDVEGIADLVEEIVRIYGYESIPLTPLTDQTPEPDTYPSYSIGEKLRDLLTGMGINEVVTLSMVANELAPGGIPLVNPPDPNFGNLRTKISPSLINYAQRLLNANQQRVSIFEIGKIFQKTIPKPVSKGDSFSDIEGYGESLHLGIAMAGKNEEKNWNNQPRDFNIYDLKGILDRLAILLGVDKLNYEIGQAGSVFWIEINVEELMKNISQFSPLYRVISAFPPIIEDINIVSMALPYEQLVAKIRKVSPLIANVCLVDKFNQKLTLRITYHSDKRQLSTQDIEPIRKQLQDLNRVGK
ncbi:MAG: Phenylalanine-tRNA ligase beta subunit [Microgenomates group bacterium GW2011_GWA2_44_7]|nr:MAG: Phenylalanine-tRNA ligase beta subunit [Microgenomates group bacterium GW2011_GWA2_44_7]